MELMFQLVKFKFCFWYLEDNLAKYINSTSNLAQFDS